MNYSDTISAVYNAAIVAVKASKAEGYRTASMLMQSHPAAPWCDICVKMAETSVRDIADGPKTRRHGVLYVSVYDHIDSGEYGPLAVVDSLIESIELTTFGVIEFGNTTLVPLGNVEKCYNKYVVEIPFHTQ